MSLDILLDWYVRLSAYIIPSGAVGQQDRGTIVDGFPVDKDVDMAVHSAVDKIGIARDAFLRHFLRSGPVWHVPCDAVDIVRCQVTYLARHAPGGPPRPENQLA